MLWRAEITVVTGKSEAKKYPFTSTMALIQETFVGAATALVQLEAEADDYGLKIQSANISQLCCDDSDLQERGGLNGLLL